MNKRRIGSVYEGVAVRYLQDQGYVIIETNYRCRVGEIDIIAWQDQVLCFVEVKYRAALHSGYPQEAVNGKKQKRIWKVASWYLSRYRIPPLCRFDVVAICPPHIWLIKNAFGGM